MESSMDNHLFKSLILQGIPEELPPLPEYDYSINHAPKRKDILSAEEKKLAVKNALRYFHPKHHAALAPEFYDELIRFGRIYMYRFRPTYEMYARPLTEYPHQCTPAAAIMMMIQNNLDPAVAQHPHELITYGGNGSVFQNWAQYLLTMQYLATMNDEQTLHMYSGHPLGLFPSAKEAPRVIVTNGMMVPNYSKQDDWEKFNALGVTQYGQMTAGSYMYIGPQGIVHGTTITLLNALRKIGAANGSTRGKLFVSSGLGGMSGAQPKAGNIAGCISVVAEVNAKAVQKRYEQGWVDEVESDPDKLVQRIVKAKEHREIVSIAFLGNVVELWEKLDMAAVYVDLGSDQTSLHNPWAGGYYPAGLTFEESNQMMVREPQKFREEVQKSLRRQADAVNRHTSKGTYFFDYGNAFLLEASRAGADIMAANGISFRYPSYVQDIMGPLCFDYGFGPFRWVCASGKEEDLDATDKIAGEVLEDLLKTAPVEIRPQLNDNLEWIKKAKKNKLVVGSKARILYADCEGRIKIATAFNKAIAKGLIGPIVLGRDHHDVSGTDSPFRETSNVYDGSQFTADMAIHNVIGDSFRGATWVSIHNGGGVGWGEVINGGFGLLLDGTDDANRKLRSMLYYDVNNGVARRAWAGNENSDYAINREIKSNPQLRITLSSKVDDRIFDLF
jgi:urocanate hydratase